MKSVNHSANHRTPHVALFALLVGLGLLSSANAYATDYYVATTGSDTNTGTMAQPFATLQKGANTAAAGDTVYIRGGTYSVVTPTTAGAGITFTKSGTSDANRIRYWAYSGEVPVFDFANLVISTTAYTHGFVVTGSWLHFRGLEIKNVPENTRSNNGIAVNGGGNDIFELLNMHHNKGNGIFIGDGGGGHLILNCDAHDNYDPTSAQGDGQNADGFGLHYQTKGAVSTFRGCRSWWNSDDGYDFINQEYPGVIENCWAFGNGYINSGTARPAAGNGNGFKVGSSKTGVRHTVTNSVAWKNVETGFYANHSSGGNDWFNNTSYMNGTQYNMLASDPTDSSTTIILMGTLVHKMRNNIGFPNKNANMTGVDTAFNSWDLNITPAAADFSSVSDTGAMGPRQADGSLPNIDFMKLPAGSKMIDKGTDVGLPFVGAAPDLGAYEYGAVTPAGGASGTAGATSAGGTTNSGGASGSTSTAGTTSAAGATSAGGTSSTAAGGTGTGGGTPGTSGTANAGGAEAHGGGAGETGLGTSGTSATPSSGDSSGCSCKVVSGSAASARGGLLWSMLGALALLSTRRRRSARASVLQSRRS
jgi:Right handed beta helix region